MWDLSSGKVLTQFVCKNQVEEVISAISLRTTSSKLLTGHNKGLLKIFDIERPDEAPSTLELKHQKKRLRGPLSSIAVSGDHSMALGSFDNRVYMVDNRNLKKINFFLKQAKGTGVTQVKYLTDTSLLVASRQDCNIAFWDIRHTKDSFVQYNLLRSETLTNQRMYFDVAIFKEKTILVSGTVEGSVIIYDLTGGQCMGVFPTLFDSVGAVALRVEDDKLLLVTGSGQRHFSDGDAHDSDDSDPIEDKPESEYLEYRNGLRLWRLNI